MEFYQAIPNKQRIFREQLTERIKVITSERELTKTFNEHYISIVEKGSGIKPKDISKHDQNQNIQKTIREIKSCQILQKPYMFIANKKFLLIFISCKGKILFSFCK